MFKKNLGTKKKRKKKSYELGADLNPDHLGERQTLYHGAIAVSMSKCSKSMNL